MSRYFHRTSADVALKIVRGGFRDGSGSYGTLRMHRGVWLSNVPLDINEGADGDALLAVRIPKQAVEPFEWVEEWKGHREFLVPAKILNGHAVVSLVELDTMPPEALWGSLPPQVRAAMVRQRKMIEKARPWLKREVQLRRKGGKAKRTK